jgi:hypothetical protein
MNPPTICVGTTTTIRSWEGPYFSDKQMLEQDKIFEYLRFSRHKKQISFTAALQQVCDRNIAGRI